MLVRAGDGEWLQLRPVGGMPPGGFRSICGHDAANLLELDDPMPVVAFGDEGDAAMVDAICLTHDGGIALLAATFGEQPAATMWRLLSVAGTLRGMSMELFAANCAELHGASPASWLAERVGMPAATLEQRMSQVLETGAFDLVLVTPAGGPGELAVPMRFLQAGPARVRAYEVEILRAGEVQAIEGIEVTLDGERAEDAPQRRPEIVEPVSEPEQAAEAEPVVMQPEPDPVPMEPQPMAIEPEPELATEPEVEAAPQPPEAPLGEPSTEDAFVRAIDRLDHRSSALMRFLHGRLLTYVGEREYTCDAETEYFVGWTTDAPARPLVGLDSAGAFTVVLSSLPEEERAEYAAELAGLRPDGDAARLLELGVAELSVTEHLNDETLLEYVIDNFAEALPGGRAAFEEAAAEPHDEHEDAGDSSASDVDDDFFAGVSARHEPEHDEVAHAADEVAHAPDVVQEDPADQPPRGAFARRLRRRDAA